MAKRRRTRATSDPELAAKVEAACKASGMSKGELLTALAGEKPLEVPGTFEDAARDLYQMLSCAEKPAAKLAFFERLTEQQRGILVAHLAARGFTWLTISHQVGIPEGKVKQLVDEYAQQLGYSIMSQSLEAIVGDLSSRHAHRYAMALQEGDYKAMLAMDQAWVKMALDLGVAERAAQRFEVSHTIEDNVKGEIERMLDIERKKRFRLEQKEIIDRKVEDTTEVGSGEE